MSKNQVYFVLYIVLITELLIVIHERDILEAQERYIRDNMITTLAEIYQEPVYLTIPQKESEVSVNKNATVQINAVGLYSDEEKELIEYNIDISKGRKPRGWPEGGISNGYEKDGYKLIVDNGNAIFQAKIPNTGDFKFNVSASVERILPSYLPKNLLQELKHQIGAVNLKQRTEKEDFEINVIREGVRRKETKLF